MQFQYKGKAWGIQSTKESIDAMIDFAVRKDDVFVCTFGKSGTHWMIEIVNLILYNGDVEKIPRSLKKPLEFTNFLKEVLSGKDRGPPHAKVLESEVSPRVIFTHTYLTCFPKQALEQEIPIIYLARNVKDVIVSMYDFLEKEESIPINSFDDFFEMVTAENSWIDTWYEHVQEAWALREKRHVLFVTYEELQKELRSEIQKICKLIGREPREELLTKVISNSSIKQMKKNYEEASNKVGVDITRAPGSQMEYLKKGVSGRWREYFSEAQDEKIDKISNERMKGYEELSRRLEMS